MRLSDVSRWPVGRRIFLAIFVPSALVLFLGAAVAFGFDVISLRASLVREAEVNAKILARATRSALSLDDSLAAREILSSLDDNPEILEATILTSDGKVFAHYARAAQAGDSGAGGESTIVAEQDLIQGKTLLGKLRLRASLGRFHARMRFYGLGVLCAWAALLAAAATIATRFQAQLSRPLRDLAATARQISTRQDYSVRAPDYETPEFAALTSAFNHMLGAIDSRSRELLNQSADLRRLNTNLAETNKELEAFTYSVSHDLRTPLRAISNYAQFLENDAAALTPELLDHARRISKNAVKMARLIDELLAFSRVGSAALSRQAIDPVPMVQKVWNELALHRGARVCQLELGALAPMNADSDLMELVFQNLLDNAIKYSRGQPVAVIRVGSVIENHRPVYFVKDNGVGFDMRFAAKLFGVFQRLHSEKEFEGTGVGLAIVERIISRHGGHIRAESTLGSGAAFYFTVDDETQKH